MVDLRDPAIAEHHLRARFIERVCEEGEQRSIAGATDPKKMLWTLFAAKEAAYKVAVKLGLEPGFAHRRFVVSPDLDHVRFEERSFALRVEGNEDWVHAIAGSDAAVLSGVEEGLTARGPLLRALATELDRDIAELAVERDPRPGSWDGFAPPRVTDHGAPVDVDVSLSHDGRFVAFAASRNGQRLSPMRSRSCHARHARHAPAVRSCGPQFDQERENLR